MVVFVVIRMFSCVNQALFLKSANYRSQSRERERVVDASYDTDLKALIIFIAARRCTDSNLLGRHFLDIQDAHAGDPYNIICSKTPVQIWRNAFYLLIPILI